MKIFLSWSGELSRGVARALEKWLPYMIQSVQPFLSSDITKGDRWGDKLVDELNAAQYAIICVTKYNLSKPWLHFETGALAKLIGPANVAPLLFGLHQGCVAGSPLAQFQSVLNTKDEMLRLVHSINSTLDAGKVNREILTNTFEQWWPHLEADLQSLSPGKSEETQTPFSWLYVFEDLQSRESQAEVKTVWIVAPDISRHMPVVRQKMAMWGDKVECRIFVREADESLRADLEDLRKSSSGRVDHRNFRRDDFDIEVVTDCVILNANPQPRVADMPPRHMFLRLPIDGGDYWIIVGDTAAERFSDRFNKLWETGRTMELAVASAA
jgi:hypothetical protein